MVLLAQRPGPYPPGHPSPSEHIACLGPEYCGSLVLICPVGSSSSGRRAPWRRALLFPSQSTIFFSPVWKAKKAMAPFEIGRILVKRFYLAPQIFSQASNNTDTRNNTKTQSPTRAFPHHAPIQPPGGQGTRQGSALKGDGMPESLSPQLGLAGLWLSRMPVPTLSGRRSRG